MLGYLLYGQLTPLGIACEAIAPSLGHQQLIWFTNQQVDLDLVPVGGCSIRAGAMGSLALALIAYVRSVFVAAQTLA